MRRRVLIFSASFGGGHRSAARALESYFVSHGPDSLDVRVIDFFEEFAPGLNVLAKFAYQQSAQFFPSLYGDFSELAAKLPSNPVVHDLRMGGLARAAEYIDGYSPDAVISVFAVAGGVVADIGKQRSYLSATVVGDYDTNHTWLHPGTDLYFAACKEVGEDLIVHGVPWERIVVSGIPVRERFSEVVQRADCCREFGLASRFTVLLECTAAALGDVKHTAIRLAHSGVQVAAVTGTNARLKKHLESLAERSDLVKVFGFVEDMHRMMNASDVLVARAGGLTVTEAFAVGLPVIIYNPVPGQELRNVDFIINYGAGLLARDEDDVVEKVRFLAGHSERLTQMSRNAQELGRPLAAQTICERVLGELR